MSGNQSYPNLTFKNLYFETEIKISIFDLLEMKINLFTQKQFNKLIMNVSGFKKGICILIVEGKNFSKTRKKVIDNNSNQN